LARLRDRYGLHVVAANTVALMLASWTPGDDMIRTGILSGHAEHVIAYALSGAVMYAMLAPRFAAACIVAAIVAYAGLLELGQMFVPGRHAAVADFLFSATGAVIGIVLCMAAGLARIKSRARKGVAEEESKRR
jgi:VanZ family protein